MRAAPAMAPLPWSPTSRSVAMASTNAFHDISHSSDDGAAVEAVSEAASAADDDDDELASSTGRAQQTTQLLGSVLDGRPQRTLGDRRRRGHNTCAHPKQPLQDNTAITGVRAVTLARAAAVVVVVAHRAVAVVRRLAAVQHGVQQRQQMRRRQTAAMDGPKEK